MGVVEETRGAHRITQQQRHRLVTRHRSCGGFEHRLGDTGRLVCHQHDVVAVDALERFGLLCSACPGRDERLVRRFLNLDPVLLHVQLVLQHRR